MISDLNKNLCSYLKDEGVNHVKAKRGTLQIEKAVYTEDLRTKGAWKQGQ